jgi:hypothetical protein
MMGSELEIDAGAGKSSPCWGRADVEIVLRGGGASLEQVTLLQLGNRPRAPAQTLRDAMYSNVSGAWVGGACGVVEARRVL